MGTISEKLSYLADTKDLFKDRLNSLGAEITSSTTFRNYLTWLDTFYGEVSNKTDISQNGVVGRTSQESTTGKNLFNQDTISSIGSDGGTYSNGVITTNQVTSNNASNFVVYLNNSITLTPNTYYLSMNIRIKSGTGSFNKINDAITNWEEVNAPTLSTTYQRYVYRYTYSSNKTFDRILIQFASSTKAVYEITNIMLSTSSDTNFEKYTGGEPSPNPDYPQPINNLSGDVAYKVSGKNLFDINSCPILEYAFYDENGNPVSWARTCGIREYIKLDENSTYAIKYNGNNNFVICFYDKNKTYLSRLIKASGGNFTMPSAAKYIRFGIATAIANVEWCQIEKGTASSDYEPHIEPQTFNIPLGDIELCKIGNYEDKIYSSDGRFYLNKLNAKVIVNNSSTNIRRNNATSYYIQGNNYIPSLESDGGLGSIMSTKYIKINTSTAIGCFINGSGAIRFNTSKSYANVSEMINDVGELIFYANLATPTTEITQENYPSLYNALKQIQDYLTAYKINKEFILGYSSPEIEY